MLGTRCYEFIVIRGDDFINKREPKKRLQPSRAGQQMLLLCLPHARAAAAFPRAMVLMPSSSVHGRSPVSAGLWSTPCTPHASAEALCSPAGWGLTPPSPLPAGLHLRSPWRTAPTKTLGLTAVDLLTFKGRKWFN